MRENKFNDIKLEINNMNCYISNGFLDVYIKNSYVYKLLVDNKNIISNLNGKKTFYLDWNGGKYIFIPNNIFILKYNNNIVHIMYNMFLYNKLEIQYHIILRKNISGLYNYIVINNNNFNKNYIFNEIRTVYRFDYFIMNILYNGVIAQKSYIYSYLKTRPLIQDETWQLEDGTYYSKYDLAGYIRDTDFYGLYGKEYGAWLMNFNHEYFSGGPLKQDLLVHQDSLMLNYLNSTHFGSKELIVPKYKWSKMYGPWLLYFNKGKNINLISNAEIFYKKEKKKWPFKWIKDINYQLNNRFKLTGKINNIKNKKYQIIITSSLNEKFDLQTLGYSYSTINDEYGNFFIDNIRSNIYNIYIYPLYGYNSSFLFKKNINLSNNLNLNLNIKDDINKNYVIWNIGKTDRKSSGFKFSDKNRNYIWHNLVPKNFKFYVNKNNDKDWYYCQNNNGNWKIYFYDKLLNNFNNDRILNIGIAGSSLNILDKNNNKLPKLKIYLNNILIKTLIYDNDKSIYRGALLSGNFNSEKIIIPYKIFVKNLNILELKLKSGSFIYDNINLIIKK